MGNPLSELGLSTGMPYISKESTLASKSDSTTTRQVGHIEGFRNVLSLTFFTSDQCL